MSSTTAGPSTVLGCRSVARSSLFGTVALMNLLSQTVGTQSPRFIFSSSVSASARRLGNVVEETISQDAKDAQEMGYARSKWMVERLCGVAQQLVGGGFDAVVARIGQMVGDRRSGIWNQRPKPSLSCSSRRRPLAVSLTCPSKSPGFPSMTLASSWPVSSSPLSFTASSTLSTPA